MLDYIKEYLSRYQLSEDLSDIISRLIVFLIILTAAFLADFIVRKKIITLIKRFLLNSKLNWDDEFVHHKVLDRLARLTPFLMIYFFIPLVLAGHDVWIRRTHSILNIFIISLILITINSIINAALNIYEKREVSRDVPLKGLAQVIKILVFFLGTIIIISLIIDQSPIYILSGLGAITAVIILIFKDSILGFVAGIQLITNRMVAKGDWIEMHKYGADGEVLEVSLHTVKVQNWDKTITTIPTYALISDSFKNWRGMTQSGGRRIKRSLMVDIHSIKHLDINLYEKLKNIGLINKYLEEKTRELDNKITTDSDINQRKLTNIGTFRIYVLEYLKRHSQIRQDMTLIVRQLQATEYGLPLEVYCFSSIQSWSDYEVVQADIFDHLFAIINDFELEIYQQPSGRDLKELLKK